MRDNTGLNIGHTFTVLSNAIQILNLGVFDLRRATGSTRPIR